MADPNMTVWDEIVYAFLVLLYGIPTVVMFIFCFGWYLLVEGFKTLLRKE